MEKNKSIVFFLLPKAFIDANCNSNVLGKAGKTIAIGIIILFLIDHKHTFPD